MTSRLDITVHAVQGEMVPPDATHHLSLMGDKRTMWALLMVLANALMGNHIFGDRHRITDPNVDLYVEVTYGLD